MCVFLSRCKNGSFRLSLFIVTRITLPMMDERDALLDATTGDRTVQSTAFRPVVLAGLTNRPKAVHRFSRDRNLATAFLCLS